MASNRGGPEADLGDDLSAFARGRSYNFTRRFVSLAAISVTLVGTLSAIFLSRLMVERTIHHDAEEVAAFVQGFTPSSLAPAYFSESATREERLALEPMLERIATMPGVLHVNVYDAGRRVLWSTKPEMAGKVLPLNEELDEALAGELEVESSLLEPRAYLKPEHLYLREFSDDFVETYVPIWSADSRSVVGVIELYRQPRALFELTRTLVLAVWAAAIAGGVFLILALVWLARRTDAVIRAQHRHIVQTETFAAVGEMAAAVAHNIRNPLSSIRSSAELVLTLGPDAGRTPIEDIVTQSDRIAAWIRQLLVFAQPSSRPPSRVDVADTVRTSLGEIERVLEQRGITVRVDTEPGMPPVFAEPALLSHVFGTVLANALDAMPGPGSLEVTARASSDRQHVDVAITDSGPGIAPEMLERVFVPFQTTKKSGMGVGLPLVRRVLTRLGGHIDIESQQGRGATVRLCLPVARPA